MKYLVIILLALFVSCNKGVRDEVSIHEETTILTEESKMTSETLSNQNIVEVVDYKALAPLLSMRNDTTYVVNFWATWCKPCIEELPAFETLSKMYSDNKVKVVLVSLDFPDKLMSQVLPFIEKNQIESDVILLDDADANSWIPAIDETWSGAIPATIIFNKNKRTFYERSFTYQELEKEVKSIL